MYVIMYHYVRNILNSRYCRIKGLELNHFEKQIQYLMNNGFTFVRFEEVVEKRNTLPDKSVLLTFDDGYIDHYMNVFPILDKLGIQGVFSMPGKIIREKKVLDVNKIHFILATTDINKIKSELFNRMDYYRGNEFDIPSNEDIYKRLAVKNRFDDADTIFVKRTLQVELPEYLRNRITDELFKEFVATNEAAFVDELYMNMSQIETMKKHGMLFGIHGYDHYWMNRLTEREFCDDIEKALDVFDGIVDPDNWTCCYPYGSYSDEVIAWAKRYGATSGLTTEVAKYSPDLFDIYKIPRLDTNDFPPKSQNYLSVR